MTRFANSRAAILPLSLALALTAIFGCQPKPQASSREPVDKPNESSTVAADETPAEAPDSDPDQSPAVAQAPAVSVPGNDARPQDTEDAAADATGKPADQEPLPQITETPEGAMIRDGRRFEPGQLHKNTTTMVLVYQPDIRVTWLINKQRQFLTPPQIEQAKALAAGYQEQFETLKRRRAEILENASDDVDVAGKLLHVKLDIAALVADIRNEIARTIMTDEQRRESREFFQQQLQPQPAQDAKPTPAGEAESASDKSARRTMVFDPASDSGVLPA